MRGDDTRVQLPLAEYMEQNKFAWEMQDQAASECGVKVLDVTPYLCDDKYCYGDKDGIPVYFDSHHLSEYGGSLLVPLLKTMFDRDNLKGPTSIGN